MARMRWWHNVKRFLAPAARRGRRPKRRLRWYRPWVDLLEGRLAPTVTLSVSNPAPFPKPDTGQLMGMFVVTRTGDQAAPVLVDYTTQDGTGPNGAHAGTDYVATTGTLLFNPSQVMATIAVPILGSNLFQADKTFTVNLSNPQPGVVFTPLQTFATGLSPGGLVVGDFNGDGKPDLVATNSSRVSVLLNTTPLGANTPSFAPPQTFAEGGGAPVVGDFNGDGRPDLAFTNSTSGTVSVLLNTTPLRATAPSFAPEQTFAAGDRPSAVTVGDFNGDGKSDLAIVNFNNGSSGTVSLLLNTTPLGSTTPSFAPQQTFTVGGNPEELAVGDFNGDGRPDLAVTNFFYGTVSVLLNTTPLGSTTLSFAPRQAFATGGEPRTVAVGDFNGDGKPDLAVANFNAVGSQTVSVLLNTTPLGSTTLSFAPWQTFPAGSSPGVVRVGDFNGDGKSDLAVADGIENTVSVLLNTTPLGSTTPSFAPRQTFMAGRSPGGVMIGDFNGDGRPDFGVADGRAAPVSVLLNTPAPITLTPSFALQRTFTTDRGGPFSVAVGDFNSDGKPDLAIANGSTPQSSGTTVSVLLNTTVAGATIPSFAPQQTFTTGVDSNSVAVGDFNGDGKLDLAVTSTPTVSVLLNTTPVGATTPSFTPRQTFATGISPRAVMVGDFNGDGKPDLAVSGLASVSVLLNTTPVGATIPSFAPQQTIATRSEHIAVGDFNGDGKPDLAATQGGFNTVSVLLNTTPVGATTVSFAPQQTFATGNEPQAVAVGDFNGDGKPDLAVANTGYAGYAGTTISVLLNTTPVGTTTPSFAPQQTFTTGSAPSSLAVGDFTGDGKPDLAVANGLSNTVSVLLNTTLIGATSPSFAPQQAFATGTSPQSVAVGDFNEDGRPDLAAANLFGNTVSVLINSFPILLSGSPATGTISSASQAPTAIAVVAGSTPQSAVVTAAFATSLAVDVRDAAGRLVQGVSVTFTALGSGSSGSFGGHGSVTVVTNASGRATAPAFIANTIAGSYTVTAQAAGGSNPTTSFSLTNTPAAATSFSLMGLPPRLVAGTATDFTITARDPFNNIATGYRGTVHFFSSDPNAILPADYTFTAADQGVHTFTGLILQTAGTHFVVVYDTHDGRIDGVSPSVTVVAAAADHFIVTTAVADPDVAGTPFDVTVTVQDVYGNTVTDYSGTVTFSSQDPYGATLPADYSFQPEDQGTATFPGGATLYTAGTWDVSATDTQSGITGAAYVNVIAAPAVAFQVQAPASAASGTPFDVTVLAVDPYGNTDTGYQGTVTFTTSDGDPGVVLPPDYTFQAADAGMVTFPGGVALITPGDQSLTVTDTGSGITGNTTVTVTDPGPGAAARRRPLRTALLSNAGLGETGRAELLDGIFAALDRRHWQALAGNAWPFNPVGEG